MLEVLASDRSTGPPLLGRDVESAALRSFVHKAADFGAAMLVTGDPGVGKSALLDAAEHEGRSVGVTVVRAAGVEFEAEMSFTGLHQLLLPLLGHLEDLPAPHREALTVALGLGAGPAPRRLLVSAAALGLLGRAAETRPVLAIVDDLPWLDGSSVRVLGFAARRLDASRIGFLAAARTGSDCPLLHADLPQIDVRPLDRQASSDLLLAGFPTLESQLRERVLTASAGNPLALLELPAVLGAERRRGFEGPPPAFPLSAQVHKVFARPLADLPAPTRRLLVLTALDGTGDLNTLRAAAGDDRWLDELAPAERARLVRIDLELDRITLRHPLIGSTVVALSTSAELRRAHAALADVLIDRPEECAWHLAAAAVGPDRRAADLLEVAAQHARRKGDVVRAVKVLLQAAQLTPPGADRARRLAAAAFEGADSTGELRNVPLLLTEARTADPDTTGSLEIAAAAAHHLLNGEGDVETAHLVLVGAIDHAMTEGASADRVNDALHSLMLVCHFGGRDEFWRPFERTLDALGSDAPPVLAVSRTVFADPISAAPGDFARLDRLVAEGNAGTDPSHIVRVAIAAFYADRLASSRPALLRVVRDGREGGAVASAVNALMMLCHEAFDAGRWDEAERTADEGVAWGEGLGYRIITLPGVYCEALVAAARGDDGRAESLARELVDWAVPRGVGVFVDFAHRIRGLSALTRSDFESAYREMTAISSAGTFAAHAPVAPCVALDLVEAAVHTGRHADAVAHVAAMQRATLFAARPRFALLLAGALALVAPEEDAAGLFERALSAPGAGTHVFERARISLAYGEHLRRQRATALSRIQLTAALELFRKLGAHPWADRAENELRATGVTHRHDGPERGVAALTSQELRIARLAASGLSNKQIGRQLYLSPRTVGAHLYKLFPKLGIASRAALRDALYEADGERPDEGRALGMPTP